MRSGSTPRVVGEVDGQALEAHDVRDRVARGDERRLAFELAERTHHVDRALRSTAFALEHDAAHARVDRREVPVEELLRVVRLRGDPSTFAQLEHGLEHRGLVASRSDDRNSFVRRRAERLSVELRLDRVREPADVLAEERARRRDRARVARRVAVALLDLGSRDDDVVDRLRERALPRAGDQPGLARERLDRLERERASRPRG